MSRHDLRDRSGLSHSGRIDRKINERSELSICAIQKMASEVSDLIFSYLRL